MTGKKMTEQEANAALAEKVRVAYVAIEEATKIADEYKISFDFSPAYGMGGCYQPAGDFDSSDSEGGWQSSSQSC